MAKYRRQRIDEAVLQELAEELRELRDPRLIDNFASITRTEVAADLRTARVFFSALTNQGDVKIALEKASGRFRRRLAQTLNLRLTPTLFFVPDGSMEHGAHISELLREIKAGEAQKEAAPATAEATKGDENA